MASGSDDTAKQREWPDGPLVPGAQLEPIRVVERELTRPDGTKVTVKVPVYPPFELEAYQARNSEKARGQGPRRKPANGRPAGAKNGGESAGENGAAAGEPDAGEATDAQRAAGERSRTD